MENNIESGKGFHILMEFFDCECNPAVLERATFLEDLQDVIEQVGMTPECVSIKRFKSDDGHGSYSINITLSESHVSLHSWIEEKYVAGDIYVCHNNRDNTAGALRVYEWLKNLYHPLYTDDRCVVRGDRRKTRPALR